MLKEMVNKVNSLVNKQEVKYFIKKGGHWDTASRKDLLFFRFRKNDKFPRKRGELLQTASWEGNLLAIFIANVNNKDVRYTITQLEKAEKLAPNWIAENSK